MPTLATSQSNTQILFERISSIQSDLTEIKGTISAFADHLDRLEKHYLVEHEKLVQKTDVAHHRIDQIQVDMRKHGEEISCMTKAIRDLDRAIAPLISAQRLLVWIGSAVGLSVIALVWMLITGEVSLVFP